MLVLVTYDVRTDTKAGRKRLRRIAKVCENMCQRVQNSVFECAVDPNEWLVLKTRLLDIVDKEEDSLRFYYLGSNWKRRIEHVGSDVPYDPEGPLIV